MTPQELKAELDGDPTLIGYKNSDGSFKSVAELAMLLVRSSSQPNPVPPVRIPTGTLITPRLAAKVMGPAKANALAGAVKQTFPFIADHLLETGVDPVDPHTQGFFTALVQAGVISPADSDALASLGTRDDPNYSAVISGPSRLQALFGEDSVQHSLIAEALL